VDDSQRVLLEALMYIFLILSTPLIYKVVYAIGYLFFSKLFPPKHIEITVEQDGKSITTTHEIKDDDDLVQAILQARKGRLSVE